MLLRHLSEFFSHLGGDGAEACTPPDPYQDSTTPVADSITYPYTTHITFTQPVENSAQ